MGTDNLRQKEIQEELKKSVMDFSKNRFVGPPEVRVSASILTLAKEIRDLRTSVDNVDNTIKVSTRALMGVLEAMCHSMPR